MLPNELLTLSVQGLTPHLTIGATRAAERAYATALQWGSSYMWATYKASPSLLGLVAHCS